jgi:hypothetical protein
MSAEAFADRIARQVARVAEDCYPLPLVVGFFRQAKKLPDFIAGRYQFPSTGWSCFEHMIQIPQRKTT